MKRTIILWLLAFILTLISSVYQRLTGPSHPVSGTVRIENTNIKFKLLCTNVTTSDAEIMIKCPLTSIHGVIQWRRYRSHDDLTIDSLIREGEFLTAMLPSQPPAGKIAYRITLIDGSGERFNLTDKPVFIRFKDPIPGYTLVPHIIFMITGMLLSMRTGFEALVSGKNTKLLTLATVISLFLGGLIFGPIVQKFAFGSFWTGWPLGHDLTDTKTAVAFIFWIIALWKGRKSDRGRNWIIAASIITFIIFLLPHSMLGSELDYTTTN